MKTNVLMIVLCVAGTAFGNGGPFVLKYPGGDPAAKGVLARLGPGLLPGRETRLEVVKEDLSVTFGGERFGRRHGIAGPPLATVEAAYHIRNPLAEEVEVDFGFPILRGIYISPYSMMPMPAVNVKVNGRHVQADVISNSAIYGIIRRQARDVIDRASADDKTLAGLVKQARKAGAGRKAPAARSALYEHLVESRKWTTRDATLLVEYTAVDLGTTAVDVPGRPWTWFRDPELRQVTQENLGTLGAIGEQKATQYLAHLAGRFDPAAAAGYERIFQAWGGDVRERALDMQSGKLRPRVLTIKPDEKAAIPTLFEADPTIYARVDYLDANANLNDAEKASCKAILKNLPVIFTFAPMNLVHYRVTFPADTEQTVTVTYSQYAYEDSESPRSYQLAYVVHPASLWERFGPIHLTVKAPAGARVTASVPCRPAEAQPLTIAQKQVPAVAPVGEVQDKTGELFIAIDAAGWHAAVAPDAPVETASREGRP